MLRTAEGGETIQSPLMHADSAETVGCPRRKLASHSLYPSRRSNQLNNSRTKQIDPSIAGLSFERMTMRNLDKVDSGYGEKNHLKSPNVYNGNKALRGNSLND